MIEVYIDGVRRGNPAALRQAFHPKAAMFGYKGQELTIAPIAAFYDEGVNSTLLAETSAAADDYAWVITAIAVTGNVATVELVTDGCHGHDYVDYFQLLRLDGRWWIVSRVFHGEPQCEA